MKSTFCITFAVILTVSVSTTVQAAESNVSLDDVVSQVSSKLGMSAVGSRINERKTDSVKMESRVFGDTAVELEGEKSTKSGSGSTYQFIVSQPIQIGANSDALFQSLDLEKEATNSEFKQVLYEATRDVANALLSIQIMREEKRIWEGVVAYYGKLSTDLKRSTSRGQTGELVNRQVAEKLRMANQQVMRSENSIKDIQLILSAWGYPASQELTLVIRSFEQSEKDKLLQRVDSFPSVAQYGNHAAASQAKASYTADKFDMELGLGAQLGSGDGSDVSYLVKVSAPVGQLHSRRQNAKIHLHNKALSEAKMRMQSLMVQQKIQELFSELGREESHITSSQTGQKESESIFVLAKSAFDRGVLGFAELRDLFDQMVDRQLEVNEANQRIQSLRLDIYFLAGGGL